MGRASPQTYTISYHAYQNVTLDLRKTGKETNSYAMLTLDLYVYVVMVRVALLVLIGNMTVVLHGGLYIIYPPELSKSCTFDLIIHHLCSPGLQPGAFSLTLIFRFVNRTPVHITMHLTHALSALLFASGGLAVPLLDSTATVVPRQSFISGTCTVSPNQCTVSFAPGSTYNFTCGLIIILAGPTYIAEDMKCRQDGDVSFFWFFKPFFRQIPFLPIHAMMLEICENALLIHLILVNTAVPILWRFPRQDRLRMSR